jgi:hypothetical protein
MRHLTGARVVVLACLASLAVVAFACGERVELGLANAPSMERKSEPRQQYDVIAVGDEGCASRDGGASTASAAGGCSRGGAQAIATNGDAGATH